MFNPFLKKSQIHEKMSVNKTDNLLIKIYYFDVLPNSSKSKHYFKTETEINNRCFNDSYISKTSNNLSTNQHA